jgi:FixJ family two-component response regulator
MSSYCQQRKNVIVERIDHFDEEENAWQEAVVQDTRSAPVPDIVAFRCDFTDWLASLSRRDRRIAKSVAVGNRTGEVAKRFDLSAGRISQLRSELAESWRAFVGDEPSNAEAAPATA